MLAIGCTGGIGSGKSTVAALLAHHGAVVIDADDLARRALTPGGAGYDATLQRFGASVRAPNGDLDRAAIAAIVFSDVDARRDLEAIVHPIVEHEVRCRLAAEDRPGRVVVLDIPLLVETDARTRYDLAGVLVVEAPLELVVERLASQRALEEAAVRARAESQASSPERLRAADFIIMNLGTVEELAEMARRAWAWILGLLAARGEAFEAAPPAPGEPGQ